MRWGSMCSTSGRCSGMGKTSRPIRILVLDQDIYGSAEVQALIAKGHTVGLAADPVVCDLIIGRKAWYMDTKHLKYIEKIALPAARARVYPKEAAS